MADEFTLVSLFIRRLKPGKTYDDFHEAWKPSKGFGVPTRVINAVNLTDDREIVSVGLVALPLEQMETFKQQIVAQEQVRHDRISDVVEPDIRQAFYVIKNDDNLT